MLPHMNVQTGRDREMERWKNEGEVGGMVLRGTRQGCWVALRIPPPKKRVLDENSVFNDRNRQASRLQLDQYLTLSSRFIITV